MDHLVPIIRGGRSTHGNVVPACKPCNDAKKHSLPLEWQPGGRLMSPADLPAIEERVAQPHSRTPPTSTP